ncbi:MAG: LCP family protein [Desulfitobacteriia bacterium]
MATKRKNKKLNRGKRLVLILALILAGLLIGTGAYAYFFGLGSGVPGGGLNKRVSFLLIGTDKRPGGNHYNADTIIVATFDPETKLISLLSIPRDTRVDLPGTNKYCKINALPALRGISELKKQVTDLTGIRLNGYVLTNFAGFKEIIDILGGVTIDVEMDMYHETGDKEDGYIDLKAGVQELDGSKALQYVRFRGDPTADIGRTARQQKLLTAIGKKMLKPSTILKLPKLVPRLMEAVETDLSLKDLLVLAGAAKSFSEANIISQTLPGDAIMLNGISYWEVNREKAREVAGNLLLGQTTDEVWDSSVIGKLDPSVKNQIAQAELKTVNISEIPGVIPPQEGMPPVTNIQTVQYSGTISWSPNHSTFKPGQKYTATITLIPKAGYTLKGVKANFFTVPGATTSNLASSGVVTAVFPALPPESIEPAPEPPIGKAVMISLREIHGVAPPEPGALPVTTIAETKEYSGTVRWEPPDSPFVEGREYRAVITLIPKAGYTLEGISENFFIVPGARASNAPGSGVITAVFPAI